MASEDSHEDQIQAAVKLVWNYLDGLTVSADLTSYQQVPIEGDLADLQSQAALAFAAAARSLAAGGASSVLTPALQAYCQHVVGAVNLSTAVACINAMYDYFITNDRHVKSRGITFGAAAAVGSPTGTPAIIRQTHDAEGFAIEAVVLETRTLKCVADGRVGLVGEGQQVSDREERWLLEGEPQSRLALNEGASSIVADLVTKSPRVDNFLSNALFTGFTGTTPTSGSPQTPTALTDYTVTTIANTQLDADRIPWSYRGSTAYGLRFVASGGSADNKITQLATAWKKRAPRFRPVFACSWIYRESSADGNVITTLGSQSTTVDATTLNNSAWNRVDLHAGLTSGKGWSKNWNQNSAAWSIELDSNTTGAIVIAYPMIVLMDEESGTFIVILPGTTASVAETDKYSWTDALTSTDSKIQRLLALIGRYLPHLPHATQVTAAGGRTLTFADANPDTITASSGSFVSDGYVVGMRLTIAGTSSNNGSHRLTAVTATVLTVDGALAAEGPLSATATLDAAPWLADPS